MNLNKQELLEKMSELVSAEPVLTGTEVLDELENWDSLAVLSVMTLVTTECDVVLSPKDIRECRTVDDLVALIGAKAVA